MTIGNFIKENGNKNSLAYPVLRTSDKRDIILAMSLNNDLYNYFVGDWVMYKIYIPIYKYILIIKKKF